MKLDYSLNIKQTQKLAMTTKMIQEIQILQYNSQELYSYVQEQMLSNPVLDAEEINKKPVDGERTLDSKEAIEFIKNRSNDGNLSYKKSSHGTEQEGRDYTEKHKKTEETLRESLMLQLATVEKNDYYKSIGEYIIETLDENGYMTASIDEIADILDVDREDIKKVAKVIRKFDPSGVCAIDLRDCLLIQLRNSNNEDKLLYDVVKDHLRDIGENKIQKIAKSLGVSLSEIEEVRESIKKLNPKPGKRFSNNEDVVYVSPDVIITKTKEGFQKEFTDDRMPSLMISSYYKSLVESSKEDKELEKYLTDKINSALWIMRCIEKRQNTIRNVIDAIMEYQFEFFEKGEMYLKPLTLKVVADEVGVHESTISRTINGKHIQFDGKIYELKYFFSSGITGHDGGGVSSTSVKINIKELIEGEDPKKPLSDQSIADKLNETGFEISRRTVTKYRESMNIPSTSKRRRF